MVVGGGKEADEVLSEDGVGVTREDDLADESRDTQEGGGENDRDDAGGDDLEGENRADIAIGGVTMDALGVVDG